MGQVNASVEDRDRHTARSPRRSIAGVGTEQTAPRNLRPAKTFKGRDIEAELLRHARGVPAKCETSIRLDIDLGEVALGDVRARRHGAAEAHRVRAPSGSDHTGVDLLPGIQAGRESCRERGWKNG